MDIHKIHYTDWNFTGVDSQAIHHLQFTLASLNNLHFCRHLVFYSSIDTISQSFYSRTNVYYYTLSFSSLELLYSSFFFISIFFLTCKILIFLFMVWSLPAFESFYCLLQTLYIKSYKSTFLWLIYNKWAVKGSCQFLNFSPCCWCFALTFGCFLFNLLHDSVLLTFKKIEFFSDDFSAKYS